MDNKHLLKVINFIKSCPDTTDPNGTLYFGLDCDAVLKLLTILLEPDEVV